MRATTRLQARLNRIYETVAEIQRLLNGSTAVIEKILASETKWNETFGAKRRREVSSIPVEFADVDDAEIVLSVVTDEPEPVTVATKAHKK